ncbi:MAG: hypothetical protein QOD86_2644 [Miltoncostaeaceae bacterium]|nr:hypothetical protein [Miltoncostaeaceae bacterium]
MRRPLAILALGAALAPAAWASWPPSASASISREAPIARLPPPASAGQQVLYGHVRSLVRRGRHFEMRFDPALWLTGVAAERAAREDGAIGPGEAVPNDYYVVDESHRLLTYVVAGTARVTVLTRGVRSTPIAVTELSRIVAGGNPRHRRLLEPKAGFWLRVGARYPNPVLALDQQYQP